MAHLFVGTRIFLDDDTLVEIQISMALLWDEVEALEDVSYLWPEQKAVTSLKTCTGNTYHVLSPFNEIVKQWQGYLNQVPVLLGLN